MVVKKIYVCPVNGCSGKFTTPDHICKGYGNKRHPPTKSVEYEPKPKYRGLGI